MQEMQDAGKWQPWLSYGNMSAHKKFQLKTHN